MCDFACAPLDRVATAMDRKYGIDQLASLVSTETALKYGSAIAKLNAAINSNNPEETKARAEVCIRGLNAMDAEATAAGHKPLPPEIWEAEIDGVQFGIIREPLDQSRAEAIRPGLPIYTMREIANAMAIYRMGVVEASKAIPTQTKPVTALEKTLDDFLPF